MSDSSTIHIRLFVAGDYHPARALWERTEGVGLNEADTEAAIHGYLQRNPGLSAVATDAGEIIAAVLCGHDGRRAFLDHLAVSPAYRGKGVGRRLIEFCFAQLSAAGIPRCNVFVYDENQEGIRFFRHNGWYDATWRTMQKRI